MLLEKRMLLGLGEAVGNHFGAHFLRCDHRHPAEFLFGFAQVAVVQLEAGVVHMRVLVDVGHTLGVKAGRAPLDAVHGVAFFQQEFGQVRAVLAGDASDEGTLGWVVVLLMLGSSGNLDRPAPGRLAMRPRPASLAH